MIPFARHPSGGEKASAWGASEVRDGVFAPTLATAGTMAVMREWGRAGDGTDRPEHACAEGRWAGQPGPGGRLRWCRHPGCATVKVGRCCHTESAQGLAVLLTSSCESVIL